MFDATSLEEIINSKFENRRFSSLETSDVVVLRILAYFCEYGDNPMAGCNFVLYCVERIDIATR